MMKKMGLLTISLILITYLTGCGGGGSSSGGGDDKPVTNTDILALLDKYEKAVEAYDVDGMLDCLDDSSSFSLTINEGSYSETKNFATLKEELEKDEDEQLAWRKPTGTTTNGISGHNYKLDLRLGTPVSGNESSSGAVVKQTFEVWESSDEIPLFKSDSGNIVWTLAKNGGEWKATKMVINYNIEKSAAVTKAGKNISEANDNGFGFGRVGF